MRHIVAPISCVNASNCRASFCRTHSRVALMLCRIADRIPYVVSMRHNVAPRHIVTCDISSHPYSCARAGPPQSPNMDRGRRSSACSYATRLATLRETRQNKHEQSKASLAKHGQDRTGKDSLTQQPASQVASLGKEGQDREG